MIDYPKDEDGNVLRELENQGVNMNAPLKVEFYCYAENLNIAQSICKSEIAERYELDIFDNESSSIETERYSVYLTKTLLLTYDNVISEQNSLNNLLSAFNTKCDGWGVLVNN